jgi:hypothetical protein
MITLNINDHLLSKLSLFYSSLRLIILKSPPTKMGNLSSPQILTRSARKSGLNSGYAAPYTATRAHLNPATFDLT